MNKLKKQLQELQKQGYESIGIEEVLLRIRRIQSDAKVKRLGLND